MMNACWCIASALWMLDARCWALDGYWMIGGFVIGGFVIGDSMTAVARARALAHVRAHGWSVWDVNVKVKVKTQSIRGHRFVWWEIDVCVPPYFLVHRRTQTYMHIAGCV